MIVFRLDESKDGGWIVEAVAKELFDCAAGGSTHKRVQRYFDKWFTIQLNKWKINLSLL